MSRRLNPLSFVSLVVVFVLLIWTKPLLLSANKNDDVVRTKLSTFDKTGLFSKLFAPIELKKFKQAQQFAYLENIV